MVPLVDHQPHDGLFFKVGCHAHIAKQGEHASVEVEDRTRMLALLRDANMAPRIFFSRNGEIRAD